MAGVVEFYREALLNNIKPIIGSEIYCTRDVDFQKDKNRDNYHLVILCKDREGYRRLSCLLSEAALSNFFYKPRVDLQKLKYLQGHCVATSACLKSPIADCLEYRKDAQGRVQEATDPLGRASGIIEFLQKSFGRDNFYLEIQDWDDGTGLNLAYCRFLVDYGKKNNIPLVITTDAHYLKKEDHAVHELLIAAQLKMSLEQYKSGEVMRYGPHFYLKSPNEMLQSARKFNCEDAVYNTNKIADECRVELELGKFEFPKFDIEATDDYEDFQKWKEKRREGLAEPR